ncbi:polysaccharide deacetylase family protein [Ruegeria pomeroyi]|nr:polysaccharide deacetylase family protein [Ruegeria pomeroyi]
MSDARSLTPHTTARRALRRRLLLRMLAVTLICGLAGGGLVALAGVPAAGLLGLLAGGAGFLAAARFWRLEPGVPVLTYHSVSDNAAWLPWRSEISIRPASLDRQLRLFRRMGMQIVDSETLVRARLAGRPVPGNWMALHFDDGYLDNWVAAAPILRRHGACAALFVSTDFIAPPQPLRPMMGHEEPLRWDGYLSWDELRALEAEGTFRIEAHGTDHGRIATGPETVDRLTPENAGRLSWMQWARMPGDKHDWYLRRNRPVPLGSAVPVSAPALAARGWSSDTGQESDAAYDARVRAVLATSREVIAREMGRAPVLFCWPQNQTSDRARALAREAGFLATTAGQARNTASDRAATLSRVHIGEDYAGFRCGWIDDLAVRAQIRCFQGYVGWVAVLGAVGALRRVVRLLARLRPHGRRAGSSALQEGMS